MSQYFLLSLKDEDNGKAAAGGGETQGDTAAMFVCSSRSQSNN